MSCVFTSSYSPLSGKIKNGIKKKKQWHIVTSLILRLGKAFKDTPLFAYKWGKNVRDKLVSSDLSCEPLVYRSVKSPCFCCALWSNEQFRYPHSGKNKYIWLYKHLNLYAVHLYSAICCSKELAPGIIHDTVGELFEL